MKIESHITTAIECLFSRKGLKTPETPSDTLHSFATHLAYATTSLAAVDRATVTLTHPIARTTLHSSSVVADRPPFKSSTDPTAKRPLLLELPVGKEGRGYVVLEGASISGRDKARVTQFLEVVGMLLDAYAVRLEMEERVRELEQLSSDCRERHLDSVCDGERMNGMVRCNSTEDVAPLAPKLGDDCGMWDGSDVNMAWTGVDHDVGARQLENSHRACELVSNSIQLPDFMAPLMWTLDTGVIACDADGTVTYMNAFARDLLMVKEDQDVCAPLTWLFNKFPQPLLEKLDLSDFYLCRALRGEAITNAEHCMISHKFERKCLFISSKPLLDKSGMKIGAVMSFVDLTEHEAKLGKCQVAQDLDAQFYELGQALPHMIWIGERNGAYNFANRAWTDYADVSIEHVKLGTVWPLICHPDDVEPSLASWSESLRNITIFECHARLRRKDGCYRWHLIRGYPLKSSTTGELLKWYVSYTDVHEHRESLRLAQEVHAQLLQFISNSPMVAWAADANGIFTFSDGKGLEVYGLKPGQLVGTSMHDFYPVENDFIRCVNRVLANGESSAMEFEEAGKWWVKTFSPLLDNQKEKVIGCVGICLDITPQKTAIMALAESEKRAKRLIESNLIGVIIFDQNGDLIDVNDAYLDIIGVSPAEYEASRFRGDDAASHHLRLDKRIIDEAMATDVHLKKKFEHFINRKDGSQVPVLVGISALDASKKEFVAFTVDLTEQVKLLRQAQEAEQRLRDVVNNLAGVFMWCIDSSGSFTVCDGKGLLGLTSSPPSRLLGTHYTSLFGDTPEIHDCIARALDTGKSVTATIHHAGTDRYFETHFSPIRGCESAGEGSKVVGICTDITERLHAERALQDSVMERNGILAREAAAKEASKMKSEFLATMRTPIAGVIGLTDILLETELTPQQREYGTYIRMSAECLLTVINDILDFSKVEAGKMELDLSPFDVRSLVRNVVKMLDVPARQKNIGLSVKVELSAQEEGVRVVGDEARIRQVLINFLSNAIKFTSPHGHISLTLTSPPSPFSSPSSSPSSNTTLLTNDTTVILLAPGTEPPPSPSSSRRTIPYYRFEVRDSGIGMSEETIRRLFRPFSQADASTARRFGGTGLGLSIAKKLVELMGGRITVSSVEGVGSVFAFDIPLPCEDGGGGDVTPTTSTSETVRRNPRLGNVRVLVAEDNQVNQLIASKMLEKMGVAFTIVENGRAALEAIMSEPYDLVLMDCQMP
ncbi:hypothetical protein HK104_002933, partial [Borealophlyctis nickersoniae]